MENLASPVIIIRRPKKVHAEEHGGAWKVAMADFAIAMMALFIVLWLTNTSNEQERQAIAGYFQDPKAYEEGKKVPSPYIIDFGGSPTVANNIAQSETIDPDHILQAEEIESMAEALEQKRLEKLKQEIETKINASPTLSPFKDQITLDITTEGLRIQITDKTKRPMFNPGSAELKYYSEDILYELAPMLSSLEHKLSITGHTDSDRQNKQRPEDDINWSLSASRADAARRALMEAGVRKKQIAQVIGMADKAPFIADDPFSEVNRRIAITILNQNVEDMIESRAAEKGDEKIEQTPAPEKIVINRTGTLEQSLFDSEDNESLRVEILDNSDPLDSIFSSQQTPGSPGFVPPISEQQQIQSLEKQQEAKRKQALEQSTDAINKLQQQRESDENTYDNPPNQEEKFW